MTPVGCWSCSTAKLPDAHNDLLITFSGGALCCCSSTSSGNSLAGSCSQPRAWAPSRRWKTCRLRPVCRKQPPEPRPQQSGGRQLKPHDRDQRHSQQTIHHPGEQLDKSIVWIHREKTRCTCASRMTARHSPLFTLRPGQSGLGIYTSQSGEFQERCRCRRLFRRPVERVTLSLLLCHLAVH
jgi:hypothetical protein